VVSLAALDAHPGHPLVGLGLRGARPRAVDGRAGVDLDVLGLPGLPVGALFCILGIVGNCLDPQRHRTGDRAMTRHAAGTMVLCFALTVSVAVSIGLAAILGIQASNANMLISVKEMFNAINKFPLAAIPFFILAGNLMETGGISRRLVEFAKSIVGGVQGGLPMTCVLTCMIFAAVSGSSVATTFAIGAILIPALIKHGYPTSYAAALQATSAELGVIIPPSIPMILYGVSAEVSIGELFIAGFGPGLLIGGALMLFVWVWCKWKGWGKNDGDGRLPFGRALCRPAGRC
jgi:C4-dicarboxylate transporter DctM subunit